MIGIRTRSRRRIAVRNGSHRFWLCIAAAVAVIVTAVPAASASEYDTQVTIARDGHRLYHGDVKSEVGKCEGGRRVTLFRKRSGADQKLGTVQSSPDRGTWGVVPNAKPHRGDRFYAKVTRKVKGGDVCRADRSQTLTHPEND